MRVYRGTQELRSNKLEREGEAREDGKGQRNSKERQNIWNLLENLPIVSMVR